MLKVLSLGAGVQSSVLLLLSARGLIPRLDAAIFADTQYEPAEVYSHLEWLTERANGIPIYIRTAGNLKDDALEFRQHRKSSDGKRFASIPLFVLNGDGSVGAVRRQCTKEYKVIVVERCIRENILELKHGQRAPRTPVVEQWMGITTDEADRAKPPGVYRKRIVEVGVDLNGERITETELAWRPVRWKNHTFPFLTLTIWPDKRVTELGWISPWSRKGCAKWAKKEYPDHPFPRSACICCPYRSNAEWKNMRDNDPVSWSDAVQFDHDIRVRHARGLEERKVIAGLPFIHRECKPLNEVDLDAEGEPLFTNECEGMCGV